MATLEAYYMVFFRSYDINVVFMYSSDFIMYLFFLVFLRNKTNKKNMNTKLLLFFAFITLGLTAQTTHQLSWANDGSDAGQQLTIEVGDTVEWTWGSGSHNLLKTSGP